MEREQIIKALECCADDQNCVECPYTDISECHTKLSTDALALIKELTEENEIKSQKRANIFEIVDAFERGRTDGVRKMKEALEQRIHSKLSYHGWYLKETVIAETAKEMLEAK